MTISPQAIEVLKQQKAKAHDQYVFPSPHGGPISPDSVNNMLKRVLERAGIPKVRFHDLRHTVATRLAESNIDLVVVKEILGHADIQTTMRYAHAVPKRKQDAISVLNSYS